MSQTQVLPNKLFDKKSEEINFAEVVGFLIMGDNKFEIKGGCNKIGRDPELCSIVLNHKTISKVHSMIECENVNDIFILDNGSTNKTMLEKVYLKPHCRYKLEHGNLITFGNISLKFILSFSRGKNIYQWFSMQNSGNNISFFDGLFNVETQINVPIIDKNRSIIKTGNIFHFNESKNSNLRSNFQINNVSSSSATYVNKTVLSPTTVNNSLNLKETVNCQIYHTDNSYNSNIFNMETQNLYTLASNVKTKNIYEKKINNSNIFNEKNKNQISSVINTPSTTSDSIIEVEDITTCLLEKKTVFALSKQDQEPRDLVKHDINAEKEKELILTDAKLIQSLEENFYVEYNQNTEMVEEQKSKNPDNVNLPVVNISKQLEKSSINNDINNYDTLKFVNPSKIISENVIEFKSNSLETSFLTDINHGKTLKDNLLNCDNEKFNVDTESSKTQNIYVNENKPTISKSSMHDSKVFFTLNKELSEEDSDSFLEITIEKERSNEFFQHSQVPLSPFKKVYENSDKPPNIQNKLTEGHINQQTLFATKNSNIFNNFIEVIESDSQQKEMKLKETPETPKMILDSNSKITEELTPLSLTKEFSSFVPDSSDENSTLSDLEVIDDSPYFKREKNSLKITNNYSLKRVVDSDMRENTLVLSSSNTANKSSLDVSKSKLRTNSESSDFSDSSYVFEINEINDNANFDLKKKTKPHTEDALKCLSFSDSDSCDIIDMTPPKVKVHSREVESVKPSSSKNCQKKITDWSQKYFFRCSTDDSKQFDTCKNLASNKILNSETLEESLKKIDLEKINSTEEKRDHKIVEAQTNYVSQNIINSPESNFFGNVKASELVHGKRNRNFEKNAEIIPNKKSKTNFFIKNCSESSAYKRETSEEKDFFESWIDCQNDRNQILEKQRFSNQVLSSKIPGTYSEVFVNSKTLSNNSSKDGFVNTLKSGKKSPNQGKLLNYILQSEANNKTEKQAELKNQVRLNDFEQFSRQNYLSSTVKNKWKKSGLNNESCLGSPCIRIAFTGFESIILDRIIGDLGGEKVDDLHLSQVLVTDRVRRTVKFLCAIGLSIPITSPQWLLESKKQKRFLNPWHHLLKCEESEEKWNFDLKAALEKSKSHKLLKDFCVFATDNVKPPVKDILNIVKCCGGTPLYDRPQVWTKQTIVVSCFEDKKFWPPWKFSFVNIVHYEFILSGVLQQSLDFELYKLR